MKRTTQTIVIASMLTALVCLTTMIIKIPSPLTGYLNLGDSIVLLCGWLLSPVYGFLAAGIGSALADFFSGYALYAPATFFIKGFMAVCAYYVFRMMHKSAKIIPACIISGLSAEFLMIFGYYLFEVCLYGFFAPLINVPANAVQGAAGLLMGIILMKIFGKNRILFSSK